jgi:GNAT superfamily N-acetyltransferase
VSADLALVRALDDVEAAAYADLFAAAPTPVRDGMGLAVHRVAGATLLLAARAPVSLFNRVIGLGNRAPATASDLDAVLAVYRDAGVAAPWVHVGPASEPAALRAWLAERGFAHATRARWAKMARGPELPAPVEAAVTVRAVGADRAEDLAAVLAAAHGMPSPIVPCVASLVGREGWHAYGAFAGDELVAGGFVWTSGVSAWLGMAGTQSAHRGRGAQRALMAARIDHAASLGCTTITTETGEPIGDERNPSLANMLRSGFRAVASRENFAPAGGPAKLVTDGRENPGTAISR